jgi:hypothetical protein
MLRAPSVVALRAGTSGSANRSQVLGTEVPSYFRYPYLARDILRLYRDFWRVVQRLPIEEQKDAAFKLRNAFRSKRHVYDRKHISKLYANGEAELLTARERLDEAALRAAGRTIQTARRGHVLNAGESRTRTKATAVDGVWQALKSHGNGIVPNLRNVLGSTKKAVHDARLQPPSRDGGTYRVPRR